MSITLTTLPGELRNKIYSYVFAPLQDEVDLLEAIPPSKSLILACKQTYQECNGIYQRAYRSFFRDTIFIGHNNHPEAISKLRTVVSKLRDADVAAIQHVRVHGCDGTWMLHGSTWYTGTKSGGWHAWLVVPPEQLGRVVAGAQRRLVHLRSCSIVMVTRMSERERREALVRIGRENGMSKYELEVMLTYRNAGGWEANLRLH